MIIIGNDVVNLYPSLDITKVVEDVKRAVLESDIKWQEVDYLEAAQYVALNGTEQQCRASPLGRILPTRRKSRGTRPGLRGAGPQGGSRGDQEQWVFPRVRLRADERRLLVATVVELATTAMFRLPLLWACRSQVPADGGWPHRPTWDLLNSQTHHASV